MRVRYTVLRCARIVRISYKVLRDHDTAVATVAVVAAGAAAANTVIDNTVATDVTTSRSPSSTSLVPLKTSGQGMFVRTIPSLVERLHVD